MDALAALTATPIDHHADTPLYLQLKHRILQLIASGALSQDAPLPAELDLCQTLVLSRATVRRCFKDLVDEGYVIRRRGQGSFVAPSKQAGGLDTLYTQVSTSTSIERSGARPSSRFLGLRTAKASGAVARSLDAPPGEELWEINRLRLANGHPVIHELAYMRKTLCPSLSEEELQHHSIYECIARASNVIPFKTEERFEAVTLDEREAKLLGAKPGAPALRIIARSLDARGLPFEASVGIARGDSLRLEATYGAAGSSLHKAL